MKRFVAGALAALLSFSALAATTTPLSLISTTGSTSGQVITSTGPSTAPGWSTIPTQSGRLLNVQVFKTSGTYTPTTGATKALVKVMAPGGGSGGNPVTSASQNAVSGAGNAGAYGEIWIASGLATQTVTIGAVGAAGSATPGAGGTGGTTSFGSLIACLGGAGGAVGTAAAAPIYAYPSGTTATCSGTGVFIASGVGAYGEHGIIPALNSGWAANGGNSAYGAGGRGGLGAAVAGGGYGAGAGGAFSSVSASAAAGAAGAPAFVVVYEFN